MGGEPGFDDVPIRRIDGHPQHPRHVPAAFDLPDPPGVRRRERPQHHALCSKGHIHGRAGRRRGPEVAPCCRLSLSAASLPRSKKGDPVGIASAALSVRAGHPVSRGAAGPLAPRPFVGAASSCPDPYPPGTLRGQHAPGPARVNYFNCAFRNTDSAAKWPFSGPFPALPPGEVHRVDRRPLRSWNLNSPPSPPDRGAVRSTPFPTFHHRW
jgi:hypothetical protein